MKHCSRRANKNIADAPGDKQGNVASEIEDTEIFTK